MAKEIAEEYASSLADLTVNSKPLINMLTILAEENIDHAGVIVDTVEKHLEKVNPDIKLPVLYLVDSIIKNVGGAYTQKFSQSIVNMFTRTFKQVDEKIRAQMFKLRETWHDVFPATKLYQLDVKVNLIDPAWPIQAQPQQSNIHPATSAAPTPTPDEEEKMRSILAKKEQELLMLQKKKVEMELEHMKRQMDIDKTATKKVPTVAVSPQTAAAPPASAPDAPVSVKQRLGPPVSKSSRIAPVSAALAGARRDPRLARLAPAPAPAPAPAAPILSNVFDIKPLERVTKRKNVITIDVHADGARRRDPRLDKRPRRRDDHKKTDDTLAEEYKKTDDRPTDKTDKKADERAIEGYIDKLQLADPKRINRLPPIPKLPRDQRPSDPAPKRKKDLIRDKKKKREDKEKEKDKDSSGSGSSPDKKNRIKEAKRKKEPRIEAEPEVAEEVIAFKELRNYHKERYMRRNRDKSFSPDRPAQQPEHDANRPEVIVENKDVDLRVLPVVDPKPAPVAQKRSSTEAPEVKAKKNKLDKFDILFGNEDVDLRQLPQVEEVIPPPPPPCLTESPASPSKDTSITEEEDMVISPPPSSPKKDWNEVKGKKGGKSTPSQLDLVRAKLAEATKGKDRLGRRLLSKSPSVERERRRTMSAEDMDMRENGEEFDPEAQRNSITVILSQAKEQFSDGSLDKNQYKELMYQVLQLNEQLKLNQAKQRESLELSKRKLHAHLQDTPGNTFGDIDERVTPAPPAADCDMRADAMPYMPPPPAAPVFPPVAAAPFPQAPWQPRPRLEDFGPRRFRGPTPFFRAKFDSRGPRIPFEQRMPVGPPLPTPQLGTWQGDSPLRRYERCESPPPLGAPGFPVPPTDYTVVDFVDRDPVKTIQIDGIPREIRFYGDTAIIMLDWDDPREIKFLPGCRRVTFDNKDSVVLSFNEGYKTVELEDQVFDIKFGAPTRELYINGRWHECCFGGPPLGVIVDGKARLLHLEGPLPQVDIGKDKRLDLVAGKINLIVDATQICSVYLDAKVQKFVIDNQVLTLRFADALRTVLINEQPFKVEFGDLPKPLLVGSEKHFVRFSALPRHVKPGFAQIVGMEGSGIPTVPPMPPSMVKELRDEDAVMEIDDLPARPLKTPSPEGNAENQGLDLLASVMPTTMDFAPGSDYSVGEPLFSHTDNKIPGLETPADEKPPTLPILGNINVTDLFAKLVATGIVQANVQTNDSKDFKEKTEDVKQKPKEDRSIIHPVDLLKPDTLRIKQPGVVARLYGGMQCSGCGARFAPEHTVRYSQHLDWHFRQNRRERDSTRRAHSRHWHYDLADWLQYEEHDTLHDTEKNWFEATGEEAEAAPAAPEAPSVAAGAPAAAHCALCGDAFRQFYNEDQEEWHLHNSVRHEHENYHPMCLNDYKASLTKEEGTKDLEIQSIEVLSEEKPVAADEEAIVIKDVEDEPGSEHSDNESVVEVLDTTDKQEPVEIEEGEEDDVIYKAEPVEQVDVRDDSDTDDDTQRRRCQRDTLAAAILRIKREPVDPDDEPIITEAEQTPVETTVSTTVLSSIDGNVQFETTPAPLPSLPLGGIRINISKTFASIQNATPEDSADEEPLPPGEEPLPPGEEPELEYKLKPSLADVEFSRQPPVHRGSELSGLCSIM